MDVLAQQAGRTTNFNEVQQLLIKADASKHNMDLAFGVNGGEILDKSKTNIAHSYIMGMLERGQPELIEPTLDSKAFDSLLDVDTRVKLKKDAETAQRRKEIDTRKEFNSNLMDLKTDLWIKASTGDVSLKEIDNAINTARNKGAGLEDIKTLVAIRNKILNPYEKHSEQGERDEDNKPTPKISNIKKIEATNEVTDEYLSIFTDKGKIRAETDLTDVVKFQNKVMNYVEKGLITKKTSDKLLDKTRINKNKILENEPYQTKKTGGLNILGLDTGIGAHDVPIDSYNAGLKNINDWVTSSFSDKKLQDKAKSEALEFYINHYDQASKQPSFTSKKYTEYVRNVYKKKYRK